jgi:hypothetical protein
MQGTDPSVKVGSSLDVRRQAVLELQVSSSSSGKANSLPHWPDTVTDAQQCGRYTPLPLSVTDFHEGIQ